MKYRSRTEIISHILDSANGGATKTKIMYKSFLSHGQLGEYLILLIDNGLLEYDIVTQTCKTTQKGFQFLKLHEQMEDLTVFEQ